MMAPFSASAVLMPLAGLTWQPALHPVVIAVLALLMGGAVAATARRLRARCGARRAWPPAAARAVVLALLLLGLLDPACRRSTTRGAAPRVLILNDVSESMTVADASTPRSARAAACIEALRRRLPRTAQLDVWSFDSAVWQGSRPPSPSSSGTDLAAALAAAEERGGACTAVVLLTDGGDEVPQPARLPRAPLAILGLGTDPTGWHDVAVAQVQAPSAVEKGVAFDVAAELIARGTGDPDFRRGLAAVPVALERRAPDGHWSRLEARVADLSAGRARVSFNLSHAEPGSLVYRIIAADVAGELSGLNNRRAFRVEIRREAFDVLYFSWRLGADLKMLRQELAGDPALTFSAVYRVGGERFTVQTGDGVAAEGLEGGLPERAEALRRFDCVIVGSFPAEVWRPAQEQALLDYVNGGGGVVWLGGEESFEGGGYGVSALAALMPWNMAGTASSLARGDFPVSVPALAASEPAVVGLRELLAQLAAGEGGALTITALNAPRALKPAAQVLMEAEMPSGRVPWVVVQRVGSGRAIVVASNTTWQWARRPGAPAQIYRRFWRQLVRAAAGQAEGGQLLQVSWDRTELRPSERVVATMRVTDPEGVRLRTTLAGSDGEVAVPVVPTDTPGTWRSELLFGQRGAYVFRVAAERGGALVEAFEKTLDVSPLQDEGSQLECRTADLTHLAGQTQGLFRPEAQAGELVDSVAAWVQAVRRDEQVSLVSGSPWYVGVLLLACMIEWALRRQRGVI